MDDVVADRRGLLAVEHRREWGHAAFLQRAVEHDAVPGVHGDEGGCAQIRHDAAADSRLALADAAEPGEQGLS